LITKNKKLTPLTDAAFFDAIFIIRQSPRPKNKKGLTLKTVSPNILF